MIELIVSRAEPLIASTEILEMINADRKAMSDDRQDNQARGPDAMEPLRPHYCGTGSGPFHWALTASTAVKKPAGTKVATRQPRRTAVLQNAASYIPDPPPCTIQASSTSAPLNYGPRSMDLGYLARLEGPPAWSLAAAMFLGKRAAEALDRKDL